MRLVDASKLIPMEMDVCWPAPRGWETQSVMSYPRQEGAASADHWRVESDRIRKLHGVPRECASIIPCLSG